MNNGPDITDHYSSGSLWDRLCEALRDDGADPEHPTFAILSFYDQFHGRGLEATETIADNLAIKQGDRLLDVGSGIGGPARYLANRFGCHVTGIDLTAEFCDVARRLNGLTGLEERVTIETGNALSMPFDDQIFDGAYSMNVSMNIEDKEALYREVHRVLRPGAWLLLSEIARGPVDGLGYPTPWAHTAASSFLATPGDTRAALERNGFTVADLRDTLAENKAFGARVREMVDRGEKSPHRAVALIHGDDAPVAVKNTAEGMKEQQIIPIEVTCVRN